MADERHILLLTGRPGIGKTTVLRQAARLLDGWRIAGFYTEEIREEGVRQGFLGVSFDGEHETVIAHESRPGQPRISKYGVDVAAIDELSAATLRVDENEVDAVLLDEIGTMECLASEFLDSVTDLLDSPLPFAATVARKGQGLISEVKNRPDALLWEVTETNRDRLPAEIAAWLQDHRVKVH
ncbi:MAG: nucleoside-triphosphatase [Thermoanaerobaculia bacterium]